MISIKYDELLFSDWEEKKLDISLFVLFNFISIRLSLKKEFSENNSFYNLDNIFNNLQQNRVAISKVLQITTKKNISTPVLSASFNWFNNLTSVDNPSNLIQAQRDFFGRHKVQKVDSSEDINIDWD